MRVSTDKKAARGVVLLLGIAALVAVSGCSGRAAPVGGAPQGVIVVAGENFWGDIASQIGGSRVKVTSIISDPSTDPHLYESSAANAAAVAQAKVVIVNGLGYDEFMSRLVAGSGGHPDVVSAQTVLGVTGQNANPHLWYDVPRVPAVASVIEQALVRADPAGEQTYAANLSAFEHSLEPALVAIETIKTKYPGAPVAYTERVPEYLLAAAGLDVKTPPGFTSAIEDGTDPSPADTQAMNSLITEHKIRLLLYNTQAVSPVTERLLALAKGAGVPVVAVTETMPLGSTYQAWQLDQTNRILQALGQ